MATRGKGRSKIVFVLQRVRAPYCRNYGLARAGVGASLHRPTNNRRPMADIGAGAGLGPPAVRPDYHLAVVEYQAEIAAGPSPD
jgi:hypothetical protein